MAAALVDRATSDMLIGPDWAMNVQICDILNREPGQAKEVIRGLKRRIGHKSSRVQLLALTLLETVIKNCGDVVHMYVAEKDVLRKMVKIVKKKPDPQVKEKILVLIDTWQEALGGPRATYPQYYAAYQELLQAGAVFPQRGGRSAPTFNPQKDSLSLYPPSGQSTEFYEEVPDTSSGSDLPALSIAEIQNARGIMDVLSEMLNAIDPGNTEGLRQEVIVDLVDQCRTYKQRVVQLINKTSDEELLGQALALNDDLEHVLVKHDSIAAGKSVQAVKPKSLQALVDLDDSAPNKQTDQRSNTSPITGDKPPLQQLSLPAPPTPNGSATSLAIIDPRIDLLSGEDYSEPKNENRALVPVNEPLINSASDQNILALADMFSNAKTEENNSNPPRPSDSQLTLSSLPAYTSATPLTANPLQLQQPVQFNQTNPIMNSQVPTGFSSQQPAQSYGVNDQGLVLPRAPWEAQSAPSSDFPNLHPQLLQHGQFVGSTPLSGSTGHPGSFPPQIAATGQPGSFPPQIAQPLPGGFIGVTHQQVMLGSQHGGLPPHFVHNNQYASMYGPIKNDQMTAIYSQQVYGSHMPAISQQALYSNQLTGYGGYLTQPVPQFSPSGGAAYGYASSHGLSQMMHGLSMQDNHMFVNGTSSYPNSVPSYSQPMNKTPKSEEKLFGDLLSMAKNKAK
ncbi:TOM1-like protein 9 [Zingiber officinale]|uniref:TOM1-like protein 9 n=1 Tax=Zingiber officinale TaxID=94328 RepID=UPI001C4A96F0|nr:TOM1-like protein 9 [Zingiber officinale]